MIIIDSIINGHTKKYIKKAKVRKDNDATKSFKK
jgi:hypothetical protein